MIKGAVDTYRSCITLPHIFSICNTLSRDQFTICIIIIIIHTKKLLIPDWLTAAQFKCNTSANYTSYFCIMSGRKTIRNLVGQWYHVKQWQKFHKETLKIIFLNPKKWLQEISSGTFYMQSFSCLYHCTFVQVPLWWTMLFFMIVV